MNTDTIDIPSTAIAVRQSSAVGQALGVDEILAQVHLIQNVMSRVMKEGEHFGTIPGCGDKKTLLQPGAQKLTMTFRLAPEYEIQEVSLDRGHKEYRILCTLKSIQSGTFVGQGVGCCSTMESKYRWRGGSRKCPKCGKETIIKGKAEFGGGWLCFAKKGGCGAKWNDGAAEIEGQSIERVEHDNPADFFNTVLKMAKKRAFVDATITATAASDIFTQDIGDEEGDSGAPEAPKPTQTTTPPVKAPPAPVYAPPKATVAPPAMPTDATRKWFITQMAPMMAANPQLVLEYFQKIGQLLPTETLEDLPFRFVPATRPQLAALSTMLADFEAGGVAKRAFLPHGELAEPTSEPTKAQAEPEEMFEDAPEGGNGPIEAWRKFPMPFGKQAGTLLEELDKKYLFGLWANYVVETEYNGKAKKPETIAKDTLFRQMLNDAGVHYKFEKKD